MLEHQSGVIELPVRRAEANQSCDDYLVVVEAGSDDFGMNLLHLFEIGAFLEKNEGFLRGES